MSTPQVAAAAEPATGASPEELLSAEIARRLSLIATGLSEGKLPAAGDLEAMECLSRLKAVSLPRKVGRKKKTSIIAFAIGAVLLLAAAFIRLPGTPVELDVHATQVKLKLTENRPGLMIPGELGEVVALKRASVFGAENVDPPSISDGGNLKLNMAPQAGADLAIRLQELALPAAGPASLTVGIAYGPGLRGLTLAASGNEPAVARFGEVISVGDAQAKQYAIRPVRASGKLMRLELFPIDADKPLTVLRDVSVSELSFEADDARSSLLSGAIIVKSLPHDGTTVQPGDRLDLRSDRPLFIRELTLSKGEIKATVSSPHAIAVSLGDDQPQNLMPTIFDWVRLRWPTQLYATLSALIALWFAIQRWWESP